MKPLQLIASILAMVLLSAGPVVHADTATWATTLQQKIQSLDLSDTQKSEIAGAFVAADEAYGDAIAATRATIGEILTDEQKAELGAMANAEIQRRLEGDTTARTKSIADIASDLGVTDAQSAAIREALGDLGGILDGIDADLVAAIKSYLNEEQLAKVASWF
jgi:hypothetical protein